MKTMFVFGFVFFLLFSFVNAIDMQYGYKSSQTIEFDVVSNVLVNTSNSSRYWDDLDDPSDIDISLLNNDAGYVTSSVVDDYYTSAQVVAKFVNRTDWTTIDDYPVGCGAGEYVTALGDTLTCASVTSADGYFNSITNFTGTLTDTKYCTYDSDESIINCTSEGGVDTVWAIDDEYLINNSGVLTLNETLLNATIDARDSEGYWTQTGSDIYFNTGNVGIGTTNPSTKLEIVGGNVKITRSDSITSLDIDNTRGSGDGSANMGFQSLLGDTRLKFMAYGNGGVGANYIQSGNYNSTGNRPLTFSGYYGNQGSNLNFNFATSHFVGNVGIGTTTPQNKLDVEGGAVIGATYSGTNTAPTNGLLVEGNVGIGTNTPENTPLTIVGSTSSLVTLKNTNIGQFTTFRMLDYQGNEKAGFGYGNPNVILSTLRDKAYLYTIGKDIVFTTNYFGTSESMTLKDGGNVGIGTTAPKNKLDVEGGAVIGATYSGTNTAPTNGLLVEGNVGIGTASPAYNLDVADEASGQVARIGQMGVYADGKIGIGRSPGAASGYDSWVDIDQTTSTDILFRIRNRGTGGAGYRIITNEGNYGIIDFPGTAVGVGSAIRSMYSVSSKDDSNLVFSVIGEGESDFDDSIKMKIMGSGNVGIGTTTPATKLDVDGIIKTIPRSTATCDSDAEGGIYYDSDDNTFYGCNSTSWVALS